MAANPMRLPASIKKDTFPNGAEKIFFPYLDWRIDPAHLIFLDGDPTHSLLKHEFLLDHHYDFAVSGPGSPMVNESLQIYNARAIGQGGYGKVLLALNPKTHEWVALKQPIHKQNLPAFREEVEGLRLSGNLKFYDIDTQDTVMQLLPGHELYSAIINDRDNRNLSPQACCDLQRLAIAKDILKKIAGMHKDVLSMTGVRAQPVKMIHRDIKTNNIMLDIATSSVRYCDYGMAAELSDDLSSSSPKDDTKKTGGEVRSGRVYGTSMFIAPELITNTNKIYNEATEMYALGMTLAEIFGVAKYAGKLGVFQRYEIKGEIQDKNHFTITKLITMMVDPDPAKRPSVIVAAQMLNKLFAEEANKIGLKTGVLSLADFIKLDEKARGKCIQQIIIQKINAVALTALDSDNVSNKDYYQARYLLMNAGIINVAPFMAKAKNQEDVLRMVKDHYDGTFATVKTEVHVYVDGKFIDKTPGVAVSVLGRKYSEIQAKQLVDVVLPDIQKKLSAVMTFMEKREDKTVISQLPSELKEAQHFILFVQALETAYLKSLQDSATFLNSSMNEDKVNKADGNKYVLPRALGVLLKSAYEVIDKLKIEGYMEKASGVRKIVVSGKYSDLDFATKYTPPVAADKSSLT